MTAASDSAGPPQRLKAVVQRVWHVLAPFLALALVVVFFAAAEVLAAHWPADVDFWKPHQWQFWPALVSTPLKAAHAVWSGTHDSSFVSVGNFRNVLAQTATVAVGALGMTIIIIAGGIDLSAGTALALCATAMAVVFRDAPSGLQGLGLSPEMTALLTSFCAVSACLGLGCLTGLLNGLLISTLRVVPFIVTLGTMTMYLGIAKWLANETTVRPRDLQVVPTWIPNLVMPTPTPEWILVPTGVWLVLGLALALSLLLKFTVFGRHVFAIGSNEATARLCGINVGRTKVLVYTLGGLFLGVAGMMQFARLTSGNPTSGIGLELKIIAAAVIGGASLNGGRGSVVGTLLGIAIMNVIGNGCTLLGLRNSFQDVVLGVIIIAAVTLDQFRQRRAA